MNILAVVLSGGIAKRFGNLGQLIPKALLPVSSQQTLLSRQLDFLSALNVKTVVSTSPLLLGFYSCFIEQYNTLNSSIYDGTISPIELVCNQRHKEGSIEAFYEVIQLFSQKKEQKYLMVLSDIFFESNPFLRQPLDSHIWCDNFNYLWVCNPFNKQDFYRNTGIVEIRNNIVRQLYLQNQECLDVAVCNKLLWSGMALFKSSCLGKINAFIKKFESATEEALVNELINAGEEFKILHCPAFINVNRYPNWIEIINQSFPPHTI